MAERKERRLAEEADGDLSEHRIDGMTAYEYVLANGLGTYGQYGSFTKKCAIDINDTK